MDPLAQLNDIHLPEHVNNYPIAAGWIALYILCLAVIVFCCLYGYQRIKRRRDQKRAIRELKSANSANDVMLILKWASLAYFPRQQVASLTGDTLRHFLIEQLPSKNQKVFSKRDLTLFDMIYRQTLSSDELEELKALCLYWFKHALPPKANVSQQVVNA